jgi:hypothetical protein
VSTRAKEKFAHVCDQKPWRKIAVKGCTSEPEGNRGQDVHAGSCVLKEASFDTWCRLCIKFDTSGLFPEVLRSLVSSSYPLLFMSCFSSTLSHKFTTGLMVLQSEYQRSSSAAQTAPCTTGMLKRCAEMWATCMRTHVNHRDQIPLILRRVGIALSRAGSGVREVKLKTCPAHTLLVDLDWWLPPA